MLSDNVVEAWHNFKNVFLSILNNIAPMKDIHIEQRTEPRITTDVLQRNESRDKAFHVYKIEKSNEAFNHFKGIRNEVQTLICTAKRTILLINLKITNITLNHCGNL